MRALGRELGLPDIFVGRHPFPGPGLAIRCPGEISREKLQILESDTCGHGRHSAGYQPPALLRTIVMVRQRTCCFPSCRRSARRCDLDHTVAFDKGGRTCECNLAPLCRRHHHAKQAARWHLTQDQPGRMTWHLPSGRVYESVGDPY